MSLFKKNMNSIKNGQLKKQLLKSANDKIEISIQESKINGLPTLILNGHYLYSQYNPMKDAETFIKSQLDPDANGYCLFGFGLGYHVKVLLENEPNKRVFVIEPYLTCFKAALETLDLTDILSHPNVNIYFLEDISKLNNLLNELLEYKVKWLIPNPFVKALPNNNPLKQILEEIKIKEMSFHRFSSLMEKNFWNNLNYMDITVDKLFDLFKGKKAVLVSSGPSLDKTADALKELRKKYFILAVGSAYKVLKTKGIEPHAVVISDPQNEVYRQLAGLNLSKPLIYLSTACYKAVRYHKGLKIAAFQKGYPKAEMYAKQNGCQLVDTGGSVATTAFDILIKMGFSEIVLLGQDLAYAKDRSHATHSTSGVRVATEQRLFSIPSNNGSVVKTTRNLFIYLRWFERKITESKHVIVKNTAEQGAVIKGAHFVPISDIVSNAKKLTEFPFDETIKSLGNQ
ncbi:6-hydroxymethylpterin diphosphokinase MptE-like protein [Aeribacillus sp. FSL K6-1305]|uniref:motility associated factor glycosyltransferase family protein n=1 Tax=Aeribacillus sp. FSL K6-1305 TaxID=2954569 RepID=UPI0030FD6246